MPRGKLEKEYKISPQRWTLWRVKRIKDRGCLVIKEIDMKVDKGWSRNIWIV